MFPIRVFSPEEVTRLEGFLIQTERQFEGGRLSSAQSGQCHLHFAWAQRLVKEPRILDVVEDIIGPDILVHSSTIFKKHPREGKYVSWHQDGYYLNLDRPGFVSAWLALTPSTPENGCLRVVRGSHRRGRVGHSTSAASADNLLTSGLQIEVPVDETEATDVILSPGEMSLHDVNIVHGSNANNSAISRTGFAIRYVAPGVVQSSPHHPVILARGIYQPSSGHAAFQLYPDPPSEDFARAAEAHRRFADQLRAQRLQSGRLG